MDYPTAPLVSTAKVVYIGGINSYGMKGRRIAHDGYDCTVPLMPSDNVRAIAARFLPRCITGIQTYLNELCTCCLNCTKTVPDLVVGSSQGGAVAMSLVQNEWKGAKLILLAPAWKTFSVPLIVPRDTVIVHGTDDWLISLSDSVQLRNKNKCTLIKVNDNHHLEHSYDLILRQVDECSKRLGKHKSKEVIDRERAEYLNCTKMLITNHLFLGVKK